MDSNPYPVQQSNRNLTILAWVVTILISALPGIAWIELTGSSPSWLPWAKMGLLLVLALAASFWKSLRPLRNFLIVMFAFFGLSELRLQVNFTWPALQTVFGGSLFDNRMQAEQIGKLAVSLAMIAVLLILGYKRQHFFLTRGDLRAPIEPVRLLGFLRPVPWSSFALFCSTMGILYCCRSGCRAIFESSTRQRPGAQIDPDLAVNSFLCRTERIQ
jgi:amino acid transporter